MAHDIFIVLRVPEEKQEEALQDMRRWMKEPFCYNGCFCDTGTFSDENGGFPSNIFCPNCGLGFTPKAQREYCDRPLTRQNADVLQRYNEDC